MKGKKWVYLMKIDDELKDIIIKHTKELYPAEACGIIAGSGGIAKKIYQMKNISDKPLICYFMDPAEQLKVFKEMRQQNLQLLGIYHSHSGSEAYPSARDIELAYYQDAYYVIVSLADFNNPVIRTFKIKGTEIIEV